MPFGKLLKKSIKNDSKNNNLNSLNLGNLEILNPGTNGIYNKLSLPKSLSDGKMSLLQKKPDSQPIPNSYCVDASCLGNPGLLEFRCVHTTKGDNIFHYGPYFNGTNNVGEFLAIVYALILFSRLKIYDPIYTDSIIAIGWVLDKKCRTQLLPNRDNHELFDMIRDSEKWLQENKYKNKILKWKTKIWGQMPADFGRK